MHAYGIRCACALATKNNRNIKYIGPPPPSLFAKAYIYVYICVHDKYICVIVIDIFLSMLALHATITYGHCTIPLHCSPCSCYSYTRSLSSQVTLGLKKDPLTSITKCHATYIVLPHIYHKLIPPWPRRGDDGTHNEDPLPSPFRSVALSRAFVDGHV